jgi:hypothetical protein
LVAGSEGPISRTLRKLEPITDEWRGDRASLMQLLEGKFREAFAEEQEITILTPQMLTRQDYMQAMSGAQLNDHIAAVANRVQEFVFDCALLVCGFDKDNMAYIILLEAPGIAVDCTNTGFAAIGSGSEKAVSGLLFAEHARSHGAARTLFDCFDAKIHAEMAPGVGYEWDMHLITAARAIPLRPEAKPLLEQVWLKHARSPFEKRKKDDLPDPPKDWELKLRRLVAASLQKCEPDKVVDPFDDSDSESPIN